MNRFFHLRQNSVDVLNWQMLSKSPNFKETTVQFMRAPIDTLLCPIQVLMAVVFLLESWQCISYEYVKHRVELLDTFNYMLCNYVLNVNFLKNWRDHSWGIVESSDISALFCRNIGHLSSSCSILLNHLLNSTILQMIVNYTCSLVFASVQFVF